MTSTRAPARRRTVAAALALLGCACAPQPIVSRGDASPVGDTDEAIAEFVALANGARRDAGCAGTLIWHADVAAVALAHSRDMSARDYFSHVDQLGRTPLDRVQAATIPVTAVAENIALGGRSAATVFEGWMGSPGHRRNLLDCRFTHHGVGLADGYWTHLLVRLAPPLR